MMVTSLSKKIDNKKYAYRQSTIAPLNKVTGAQGAWSLRKLKASSTYAIKVRRSSDDATLDIGFDGLLLDTSSLLAFCGAGSGYVDTWYDQSGNGNHAYNVNTANQPRIVYSGALEVSANGRPAIRFVFGSSYYFDVLDTTGLNITTGDLSIHVVMQDLTNTSAGSYVLSRNTADAASIQYGLNFSATDVAFQAIKLYLNGAERHYTAGLYYRNFSHDFVYDHTNVDGYTNNTEASTSAGYTSNLTTSSYVQIGCRSNSADGLTKNSFFNGSLEEIIIFNRAITSADRANLLPSTRVSTPTNYYVATTGSDSANGAIATPFLTLAKAIRVAYAGDNIILRAGTYSGSTNAYYSGELNNKITIQAYTAETVEIRNGSSISGWALDGGAIYVGTLSSTSVRAVVQDNILLLSKASKAEMVEGSYYQNGTSLYVWATGGGSPVTYDIGLVNVVDNSSAILNVYGSNISIENIQMKYGSQCHAIAIYNASNVTIDSCIARFMCVNGFFSQNSRNIKVTNCTSAYNSLKNYPYTGAWGAGIAMRSTIGCEVSSCTVYGNKGEGVDFISKATDSQLYTVNCLLNNCIIYDNYSTNVFVDNAQNVTIRNNLIYNTLVGSIPAGIYVGEESGTLNSMRALTIINNLIINPAVGIFVWDGLGDNPVYAARSTRGLVDCIIANNTIVVTPAYNSGAPNMMIFDIAMLHYNSVVANNIFYSATPNNHYCIQAPDGLTGVQFRNNCFYNLSNATPFLYNNTTKTFAQYQALFDSVDDINDNPDFVDPTTLTPADYKLQAGSPCIGAGLDLAQVFVDFALDQRILNDIGAFMYV